MQNQYILLSFLGILVVLSAVSCNTSPKGWESSSLQEEGITQAAAIKPGDSLFMTNIRLEAQIQPQEAFALVEVQKEYNEAESPFFSILVVENFPLPGNTPDVPSISRSQSGRGSPAPGDRGTFSAPPFSTDSSSAGAFSSKRESVTGISDGLETPDVPIIPSPSGNAGRAEMTPAPSLTMTITPPVPNIDIEQPSLSPQVVTEITPPTPSPSTANTFVLSAKYQVQPWRISMDCFWNIAGKPWVYGDPTKWVLLYYANISKLSSPENPDLISPGIILDIPSLGNEVRQGIGNAEGSPASSRQ